MKNYSLYKCEEIKDLRELVKRSAERFGNRDAFRIKASDKVCAISYRKLYSDVKALGTALISLNLCGKHIALLGENSYEWVVIYLAAVNVGCVIIPIDKELTCSEISAIIKQSESIAIAYSKTFEDTVENLLPKTAIKLCICFQKQAETGSSFKCFADLVSLGSRLILQGDDAYNKTLLEKDKMAVILFTSGTTGKSKGVMLSHKNLSSVIVGAMRTIRTERVTMSVLPIHHTYECTCGILTALYAGVTICFCDSLKYVPENLKLFKPSMMVLVPMFLEAMYKKIWDSAKRHGTQKVLKMFVRLSNALLKFHIDFRPIFFRLVRLAFGGRLKLIISGGAPLRGELVRGFNELGIKVLNGYGITECSPIVAANRNRYFNEDSVGVVLPCCKVKIDEPDENGEGEILVKGDNVMLGYYKNEEETNKVFTNGWFKTGDLGRLDEKGFLYVTGRLKNTIILSNGKNVQPEELEEYLLGALPYIKEVVVFADEKGGGMEMAIASIFVFNKDYLEENGITDPEALLARDFMDVNRNLPAYKQISKYSCRYEEFEKTTTKKIKRFKLQEGNEDA